MSRPRRTLAAVLAAILLATGGFLLGRMTAPSGGTPTTTSAAAGFLRDMQVHHAQAVDMAMTIRDLSDDPSLRQLAYDIAIGQAAQAGQMYGLLEAWDLPQASPLPPMAWMSQPVIDGSDPHAGMDASDGMPGMATYEELQQLRGALGADAERLFLTMMIAHHLGGLDMADAVLARSTQPDVVSMANGVLSSQRGDIEVMERKLSALDG